MLRPRPSRCGGFLATLLALGAVHAIHAAPLDESRNERAAIAAPALAGDETPRVIRFVVADGVGFLPGVTLQLVTDAATVDAITGDDGVAEIEAPAATVVFSLRVIDGRGQVWNASSALGDVEPAPIDGIVLLDGPLASVVLAGQTDDERADFDATLAGLQAAWERRQEVAASGDVANDTDDATPMPVRIAPVLPGAGVSGPTGFQSGIRTHFGGQRVNQPVPGGSGIATQGLATGGAGPSLTGGLPGGTIVPLLWSGETEPNDTTATANTISPTDFNTTLSGESIAITGDLDWYKFTLGCGDNVTITLTPTAPTLGVNLQFHFAPTLVPLTTAQLLAQVTGAAGAVVNLTSTNNQAGTYYFRVGRSQPASILAPLAYTVRVTVTAGDCTFATDPLEPTWGTDEAANLCGAGPRSINPPMEPAALTESRNITWTGQFSTPAGDTDTYCLDLACGEGLRVIVTPTGVVGPFTFTPTVRFRAPVLVGSTNLYKTQTGTVSLPLTASIAPAVQPGTWRVEISTNGSNDLNRGPYTVSFQRFVGYPCADAYEPDDTAAACRPIPTDGTRQSHVMYPATEQDWTCFDVTQCGSKVVVQDTATANVLDVPETDMMVFNPDGSVVDFDTGQGLPGGGPYTRIAFTASQVGTYKVKVYQASLPANITNDLSGQYDILVNVTPAILPVQVPVTQTLAPTTTQLDAQALATVPDPAWIASIAPGPGAVDAGTLSSPVFLELNSARITSSIPLPFPFTFFGVAKTTAHICENGMISFTAATPSGTSINVALPPVQIDSITDAIYPFWDNLTGRRGQFSPSPNVDNQLVNARMTVQTTGATPNRHYIVTWSHLGRQVAPVPMPGGDYNFSLDLEETTNTIVMKYGEMEGEADSQGQSATVGLENATGTQAVAYSILQPLIKPGLILTFTPSGSTYTVAASSAPQVTINYPGVRSCQYDVAADSAPFQDISTNPAATAVPGTEWFGYGPSPCSGCPAPGFPWPLTPAGASALDEAWVRRPVPFASGTFPFHGRAETSLMIHVDGLITFGTENFGNVTTAVPRDVPFDVIRSNQCPLPTMGFPNGVIAPFWDDLTLTTGSYPTGKVYELLDTSGGPGNARYIVQWDKAIFSAFPASRPLADVQITFQAILHEDGQIEYRYGSMGGATPYYYATGASATIGVESEAPAPPDHGNNPSGTVWWCSKPSFLGIEPFTGPVHQDLRLRFTPTASPAPSFEWHDAATSALLGTGATFVASATTPCNLRLDVAARDPEVCCQATNSQNVVVADRWAPAITSCPGDMTVGNDTDRCGAVVTFGPATASDSCDAAPAITYAPLGPGDFFPVGPTTVTVTARDASGNSSTCSFVVTVEDRQAPDITSCPGSLTVGNDTDRCGAVVTFGPATASDACGAAPTITYAPLGPGDFFPVGPTTVTVTATDGVGNSSTCTFIVTVEDRQAPDITSCPGSLTVGNDTDRCGAVVAFGPAVASDNCDTSVAITYAPLGPGDFFPVGPTTVTVTATDDVGNSSTCTMVVTVEDRQAPNIACPGDMTVGNDPDACGAVVTFAPATASDACDASPAIAYSPLGPGDFFPVGPTTVTATATDDVGNSSSCSFVVMVEDRQPPVVGSPTIARPCLWPPNHRMVSMTVGTGVTIPMSDNCPGGGTVRLTACASNEPENGLGDGNTAPDCVIGSGDTFQVRAERSGTGTGRIYTIGFEVTDAAGNVTPGSFEIRVPHDQSTPCR